MKDRHEERQLSLRFDESSLGDGHLDCPRKPAGQQLSAKVYDLNGRRGNPARTQVQQDDTQSLVQRALARVRLF